jgi:hypothetical protein
MCCGNPAPTAGIATQLIVERQLAERQMPRMVWAAKNS